MQTLNLRDLINRWASHVLVIGMLICLAGLVSDVFAYFFPQNWRFSLFPVFAGYVALEGMFSAHRIHHTSERDFSPVAYLIIHWIVILLVLRVFSYISLGFETLQLTIRALIQSFQEGYFFDQLLDTTFLLSLVPCVATWELARSYAVDLLALREAEVLLDIEESKIVSDRAAIWQQMTSRIMVVGIALVILSGATNLDYSAFNSGAGVSFQVPVSQQTGGIWLVAYFIQGLLVLSLAHQAALRAAWAWERIPIDDRIPFNWLSLSILMIVVVGLVALIFPTNYTFGLSATLNYLIGWVITIVYGLFFILLSPLFMLIAQIMQLVGMNEVPLLSGLEAPLPPQVPSAEQQASPDWLGVIQSAVFWLLLLGIVFYALIMYIRHNQALMAIFRRFPGWRYLLQAAKWLRQSLGAARLSIRELVKFGRRKVGELFGQVRTISPAMPSLRLHKLNDRQLVRYYYLALLRRSAQAGYPRQPFETPTEYAENLSTMISTADTRTSNQKQAQSDKGQEPVREEEASIESGEITRMTDLFIESRYTQHRIDVARVRFMRKAWLHINRILRRQPK
jgi:hypothetical protein